ncbi:MAG: LysR family transcriptional regulator [gamma proteobacterium symbiont of Bathyaustriella thionipta]|nr:LysR family transcriptional regulator [gamma proteobacterium symbiont of Bathyaustriella thionipta]MCU7950250.1 LysR family transcriptional regulator [gamma proteobacterium symbiont of Bathyaustriella thionipta]MCU7952028.1 LysR family transcriptional regulator [gamma proteobacterium symbiont of Bathyaustriella thionipta]MCU7957593.1 LysR family transcriptional regulator [gamma proteobacterium symbiont of Bathyaustriella thionipta]MCU7965767.1 LysR family transcriptional regulator [gamma pro
MDIPSIETFLIVAKKQSFSLTAETLYLTQPAISKRIASLEAELDCKLFDRVKKKIILTEAGQLFLPRAQTIVEELKASKNALSDMGGLVSGELVMATSHHIGLHHLPPILKHYVSQFPNVDLKLNFVESESACHSVENAEIELAVITLPIKPSACLNLNNIWPDPMTFVVHNNHPLLEQIKKINNKWLLKPADIQKLTQFPAILTEKETYTRKILDSYFYQSDINVQVKLSNNYLETIKMMVSVGLGWSILPKTLIDSTVTEITVPGFAASRALGIVTHESRTLSLAAQKMAELITQSI